MWEKLINKQFSFSFAITSVVSYYCWDTWRRNQLQWSLRSFCKEFPSLSEYLSWYLIAYVLMNGQRVLQRLSSIQRLFYLMDESQLQYSSCIHKYIRCNFMICHRSTVSQPYSRVERSRWWGYRVCDLAWKCGVSSISRKWYKEQFHPVGTSWLM